MLGENGAGKSTLVSILYGLLQPDSGSILLNDQDAKFYHPHDAIRNGIAMVQQHLSLIQDFTVLENLMLGQEHTAWAGMNKPIAEGYFLSLAKRYHLELPLHKQLGDLPVGIQQRVEIVKAMSRNPRVIIFDEPTAALVTHEIKAFLRTMQHLRDQGMAVIFITHRMNEVVQVADTASVLRMGKLVFQQDREHFDQNKIASAVVGDMNPTEEYALPSTGRPLCVVETLRAEGNPPIEDISLTLHESEIVGIAGVAGNGQDTLIKSLVGIHKIERGSIVLEDKPIQQLDVYRRKQLGITFIPQDRRCYGLLADFPLWENVLLNRLTSSMQNRSLLNTSSIQAKTDSLLRNFSVKATSCKQAANALSGGHQQRLIIARELSANPKVIIAYDPTRGLDIRASRFVHEQLIEAAKNGACVLLFSSELSELFLLCHSIGVLHRGKLSVPRSVKEWTRESLGYAMTGGGL